MNRSIKNIVDWLESHNKNYTQEQYHAILDLQEKIEIVCDWLERAQTHAVEVQSFVDDLQDFEGAENYNKEANGCIVCIENAKNELKGAKNEKVKN